MSARTRIVFMIAVILVIAFGAYLRAWNLSDKIFWRDEAWVASLTGQPWGTVFLQTDYPIPPLFAASAKLTGSFVHPPEVGLRLLPLLCGIALLPLVYAAARALRLPRVMALAGMTLCAGSFLLANWSRELKQYQIEAFLSTLAALLTFRIWRAGGRGRGKEFAGLIAICRVGPWLGYGLMFGLAPLLAVLVLPKSPASNKRVLVPGLVGFVALALSLAAVFVVAAGKQSSNSALKGANTYASHWYIEPASGRSWLRAGFYALMTSEAVVQPPTPFVPSAAPDEIPVATATLVAGVGLWVLALAGLKMWPAQTRWPMIFWTLLPWAGMIAAAAAHKYPFAMLRMMAIVAPGMLLAAGAALTGLGRWLTLTVAARPAAGLIGAAVLSLVPLALIIHLPSNRHYWIRHDFPAMLKLLQGQRQAGEPVLIDAIATPPVHYYAAGREQGFYYVPTASGTVPLPGFDYDNLVDQAAKGHPGRMWLLTGSGETPDLRDSLRRRGWTAKLQGRSGGESYLGAAELYVVTR